MGRQYTLGAHGKNRKLKNVQTSKMLCVFKKQTLKVKVYVFFSSDFCCLLVKFSSSSKFGFFISTLFYLLSALLSKTFINNDSLSGLYYIKIGPSLEDGTLRIF